MPDASGFTRTPSTWAERHARLKIVRRKARKQAGEQRRFSKARLADADRLLNAIINGSDFIGEITITDEMDGRFNRYRLGGVCLLVTLEAWQFRQLCDYGAELEDLEDGGDAEPDSDKEPSLGRRNASTSGGAFFRDDADVSAIQTIGQSDHDLELDDADYEPGLGSTGMTDQERWAEGRRGVMDQKGLSLGSTLNSIVPMTSLVLDRASPPCSATQPQRESPVPTCAAIRNAGPTAARMTSSRRSAPIVVSSMTAMMNTVIAPMGCRRRACHGRSGERPRRQVGTAAAHSGRREMSGPIALSWDGDGT